MSETPVWEKRGGPGVRQVTEIDNLRANLAAAEAKLAQYEADAAEEDRAETIERARIETLREAIKTRSDALLKKALGREGWNGAWGWELERLGAAVDVEVEQAIKARAKLTRIREAWHARRWRGNEARSPAEIEAAEAELCAAIEES
jgi:hypothetical protein